MAEMSERRRFPRYQCKGTAGIFQGGKLLEWVTVSDIGGCGCYLEMLVPLTVGTEVAIRLSVADILLDIRAKVACSTPLVGMGVEFMDATREQENLLAQMIQKVTGVTPAPVPPPSGTPQSKGATIHITREAAPEIFVKMLQRINEKGVLTKEELVEMVKNH